MIISGTMTLQTPLFMEHILNMRLLKFLKIKHEIIMIFDQFHGVFEIIKKSRNFNLI